MLCCYRQLDVGERRAIFRLLTAKAPVASSPATPGALFCWQIIAGAGERTAPEQTDQKSQLGDDRARGRCSWTSAGNKCRQENLGLLPRLTDGHLCSSFRLLPPQFADKIEPGGFNHV
jgi:hypothetical protein